MKFVLFLIGLILGLAGVLIGGCGVVFLPLSWNPGEAAMILIPLTAITVGGLLIWGAVALFRSLKKRPDTENPPPSGP